MTVIEREHRVLELLRAQYEEKGYAVYLNPGRELIPSFMEGYMPDAIALGDPKNVAIEVKLQRKTESDKHLFAVAERFRNQPKWEFRIVYANEEALEDFASGASTLPAIRSQLDEAESLSNAGHQRAALILAWAALEAVAVSLRGSETTGQSAMNPRQMLELLEHLGRISFEQGKTVRNLIKARNAVVHGNYSQDVEKTDVNAVIAAARNALEHS